MRAIAVLFLLLGLGACAPRLQPLGPAGIAAPTITATEWRADDGEALPLRQWLPPDGTRPRAAILALHGFNDYGNAFAEAFGPGPWWAERHGLAVFAPDQRGFGATPHRGFWPGAARLTADAQAFTRALRARYPGLPVYWLGDSMGGAVALVAAGEADNGAGPDGLILTAPAVWGRASMPLHYRLALFVSSYTIPWQTFTGRNLGIQASDNIEMLRALGRDPQVIKATRVDAIHGLANLMDAAAAAPERLPRLPLLLLYGAKDQVIPKPPVERFAARLKARGDLPLRIAVYDAGWHMLLRDRQRETVWRDIAAWIGNPAAPLPSGRETTALPLFADSAPR